MLDEMAFVRFRLLTRNIMLAQCFYEKIGSGTDSNYAKRQCFYTHSLVGF